MIDSLTLFNRLTSRTKLRHMQALVRLVELRNMGRAAKDIGISQPAMSQLVADLEELLEAQLFLRHSRGVEPTPLAFDLAEIAQRIMAAVEDGTELVASKMNSEHSFIRIAYTLAAYHAILEWALPEYVQQNPACRVQLDEVIGHSLNTTFASGDYDMVFCRQTELVGSGWTFVSCVRDRLVVVCGTEHPLSKKGTVTHEDLRTATWVAGHVATQVRRGYEKLVSEGGWSDCKEVQVVSRSAQVLLTVIRRSESISLMPESITRAWCRDGLAAELPVESDMPLGTLGFYWKPSSASIAVRRFAHMISRRQ
jgi:DNA-binding transcriptional LysR family regulator